MAAHKGQPPYTRRIVRLLVSLNVNHRMETLTPRVLEAGVRRLTPLSFSMPKTSRPPGCGCMRFSLQLEA